MDLWKFHTFNIFIFSSPKSHKKFKQLCYLQNIFAHIDICPLKQIYMSID